MLSIRGKLSHFADLDLVVVIGEDPLSSPDYKKIELHRIQAGVKFIKTISKLRQSDQTIPIIYTGALKSPHLCKAYLPAQITYFMDYVKKQNGAIRNIAIVAHTYQLERIGHAISYYPEVSESSWDFESVNYFLYGIKSKFPACSALITKEKKLLRTLNSHHISNKIFSNDFQVIFAKSFNLQMQDHLYFARQREKNIQRLSELFMELKCNRHYLSVVKKQPRRMSDLLEFKALAIETMTYPHLTFSDIELLGRAFHQLQKFYLFVLYSLESMTFADYALQLLAMIKKYRGDKYLSIKYINFYAQIKLLKQNIGVAYYEKLIDRAEVKLKDKKTAKIDFLNYSLLTRCKAKVVRYTDSQIAIAVHLRAIARLNKLPIKEMEEHCEMALHYMELSDLNFQAKENLTKAATYLQFDAQTLIQADWYLKRAIQVIGAEDEDEDTQFYLDKAKEIIDKYCDSELYYYSLKYLRACARVLMAKNQYVEAKEIYLRMLEMLKTLNLPPTMVINEINDVVKDKFDNNWKYSYFCISTQNNYGENIDKIECMLQLKELFEEFLNKNILCMAHVYARNYQRYKEWVTPVRPPSPLGRVSIFRQYSVLEEKKPGDDSEEVVAASKHCCRAM
jgi:hypothetical protein